MDKKEVIIIGGVGVLVIIIFVVVKQKMAATATTATASTATGSLPATVPTSPAPAAVPSQSEVEYLKYEWAAGLPITDPNRALTQAAVDKMSATEVDELYNIVANNFAKGLALTQALQTQWDILTNKYGFMVTLPASPAAPSAPATGATASFVANYRADNATLGNMTAIR